MLVPLTVGGSGPGVTGPAAGPVPGRTTGGIGPEGGTVPIGGITPPPGGRIGPPGRGGIPGGMAPGGIIPPRGGSIIAPGGSGIIPGGAFIAGDDWFSRSMLPIRMIARIEIRDVSSSFAMEQIKYTTEMPLDYMVLDKEVGANAA